MEQAARRPRILRTLAGTVSVLVLATLLSLTPAGTAFASTDSGGRCPDAHRIGDTGYIYYQGDIVASVKQFYSASCRQNWGYVWVWESFRKRGVPYEVGVAVFSFTRGQQYGNKYSRTRGAGFWSGAADTRTHCTAAYGYLLVNSVLEAEGYSSKRCLRPA
jgi:hypothetical protein